MKTVWIVGLVIFFAGCATQAPVQEQIQEQVVQEQEVIEDTVYFAFDFDTDQGAAPFRDYGAAYIINVSSQAISIPISTYGTSTMFSHFYYDESGTRPVFTEMMLARINRSNFLVLQPGDRILAFSVAFSQANLERFPGAMYDERIYVNDRLVDVRGGFVGR